MCDAAALVRREISCRVDKTGPELGRRGRIVMNASSNEASDESRSVQHHLARWGQPKSSPSYPDHRQPEKETNRSHLLDRVRDHGRRPFFFREDHLETHRAASSVRFHELSSLKGSRGAGQYTCTGKTSFIASASMEM